MTNVNFTCDTGPVTEKFTLKDIAKLIRVCKTNGVSHYEYGDLKLSFDVTENPSKTPSPQARGSAKKAIQIEEKGSLQEQMNLAQHVLETLHVEDPAAFEALLIDREISEAKEN